MFSGEAVALHGERPAEADAEDLPERRCLGVPACGVKSLVNLPVAATTVSPCFRFGTPDGPLLARANLPPGPLDSAMDSWMSCLIFLGALCQNKQNPTVNVAVTFQIIQNTCELTPATEKRRLARCKVAAHSLCAIGL